MPVPIVGVLGLDERAELAVGAQHGAGPQVGERADGGAGADRPTSVPWVRTTEAPSPTVTSVSVVSGPIVAVARRCAVAPSSWVPGLDDGVAADGHVDVDPGGGGVDDGDAGALMGGDDAAVELGGQLGQLHPVVDAGDQRAVVDVLGLHDAGRRCADDRDHVGQVQLLLGVVGAQPAQRRAQRRDVEGVHAGVDLADRPAATAWRRPARRSRSTSPSWVRRMRP